MFHKFTIAAFARSFWDKRSSKVSESWTGSWDLAGQFQVQASLWEGSVPRFLYDPPSLHQNAVAFLLWFYPHLSDSL